MQNKIFKSIAMLILILWGFTSLSGCNMVKGTAKGIKKDIQSIAPSSGPKQKKYDEKEVKYKSYKSS